ncbi:MAG: GTP 3',8-cyclase MoaA, partial [Betaproteobacteria bacterium]
MISEQAPSGAPLHLPPGGLVDRFGRRITYLRLSITDRCDFRCTYCMAEEMTFLPHDAVLSLEEALRLVRIFVSLGVTKVRITGGEPLVRRNALWLLQEIGRLQGLKELVLTTNGSQLARHAADLRRAGVSRLNISLDTLRPERFRAITRIGDLTKVLDGVEAALAAGFSRIRLNAVMQQGVNDDELGDLLAYAVARNIDLALIEEMPLGDTGHDRSATYLSSDAARARLAERFELIPTLENSGGPARYWRVGGSDSRVGFISPHSHNFCDTCNRVRISAQGTLYPCLGDDGAIPLLPLLLIHISQP